MLNVENVVAFATDLGPTIHANSPMANLFCPALIVNFIFQIYHVLNGTKREEIEEAKPSAKLVFIAKNAIKL
jgi:hypothetical protein